MTHKHSPYSFPSVDAKAWYDAAVADTDGVDACSSEHPRLAALIADYERVRDEREAKIRADGFRFDRMLEEARAFCDRRALVASGFKGKCNGRGWLGCSRRPKWTAPRADPDGEPLVACTQHLVEAAVKDAARNHKSGWESESRVKRALAGYVK